MSSDTHRLDARRRSRRVRRLRAPYLEDDRRAGAACFDNLSGLLRCARCGARMSGGGLQNGQPRYQCKGALAGAAAPVRGGKFAATTALLDRPLLAQVEPLVAAVATADPRLQAAIRGRGGRSSGRPATRIGRRSGSWGSSGKTSGRAGDSPTRRRTS